MSRPTLMCMATRSPNLFTLGFMSFWLTFWSLGVALLSGAVASEGGILWLFVFTHGGAEIGVAWALAAQFALAAQRATSGPELTMDLATMTARWGYRPRAILLLVWFVALGLLICALLVAGTWAPVAGDPTPLRIAVALILSAGWTIIGWRWTKTLRAILQVMQHVTVEATFDRVEVVLRRGPFEVVHELPAAALQAEADDTTLTLRSPEVTLTLPCALTPERDTLLKTLHEMAARTAAAPFEQPPLPAELTALRTPEPS
ncbi:MAG: hypothetical protein ACI8S6_005504 [Myxococcota bacterium]|jgi:hypothetical protein